MSKRRRLNKFLPYLPEESSRVWHLIIFSIAIGIFMSYYYSFANAYFLSTYNIRYLPYAFTWAGIFGFVISAGYSYLLKKIKFTFVLLTAFGFVMLYFILLRLGFAFGFPDRILAIAAFIFISPMLGLNAIVFWGVAMRLFNLRQGKRLFGFLASGEVIASIFGFFSVPLIMKITSNSANLVIFSIIGVGLACLVLIKISLRYGKELNEPKSSIAAQNVQPDNESTFQKIKANRYYRNIFILSALSMVGYVLVYFTYLGETRSYFVNSDAVYLSAFFGFFFGITKVLEFTVKTFFAGKLLQRYGLGFGLTVLPVGLFIFGVAATVALIFGLDERSFFLIVPVSFSMLYYIILRKSIENPSINTLFQPLKGAEKLAIQAMADGKGRHLGAIAIGVILIAISVFIESASIVSIGLVLLLVACVFWALTIKKVTFFYQVFLRRKLNEARDNVVSSNYQNTISNRLYYLISASETVAGANGEYLLRIIFPGFDTMFGMASKQQPLKHRVRNEQLERLERLNENWSDSDYLLLTDALNNADLNYVADITSRFKDQLKSKKFVEHLDRTSSITISNRLFIILLLGNYQGAFIQKEYKRLNLLDSSSITIHHHFIRLIELMKSVQKPEIEDILFDILANKNIELKFYALTALLQMDPHLDENKRALVKKTVLFEIEYYAYIIACLVDLQAEDKLKALRELLEKELMLIRNMVFDLLGLLHKKDEIDKIKYIIQNNRLEDLAIALEMTDIIVDEDIKEHVIPMVEGIVTDFIVQNESFGRSNPQRNFSVNDRLKNMINYDYRSLNSWIRITAMSKLVEFTGASCPELESQLFSEELVLKETAYLLLNYIDSELLIKYLKLEKDQWFRDNILKLTKHSDQTRLSQLQIIEKLQQADYFKLVSRSKLLRLSLYCDKNLILSETNNIPLSENFIYVVVEGELRLNNVHGMRTFKTHQVIGLEDDVLMNQHFVNKATSYKLLRMSRKDFVDMATILPDFTMPFINS